MKIINYIKKSCSSIILLFNLFLCIIICWIFTFFFSFFWYEKKNNVVYLENFPFANAGYQFRANKWLEILREHGFKSGIMTLIDDRSLFESIINKNNISLFLVCSMWKRFFQILKSLKYQTVIVRRELLLYNDYGNLFMEKFLLRIHSNVILDFDDDIAAAKKQPKKITNRFGRLMQEDGNKFNNTLRLYKRFIVASDYLKQRIILENPKINPDNILIIPTCVDYDKYPAKQYPSDIDKLTFGWIGGNQNYNLLDFLLPVLNQLSLKYEFKLLVIGGEEYKRNCDFEIEFCKWNLETEVANLNKIDVGLMPLMENDVSKGKGGFKLIQYMGLGIVSVASSITINKEIIEDGINGFLVEPESDWYKALSNVLERKIDFSGIGASARKTILQGYTFDANYIKYKNFLFGE